MKKYPFTISDDTNLIIVIAKINGYDVRLALDTGASDTVIDLTALLIAGYRKSNVLYEIELETAKGIIRADVFQAKELKALGLVKNNFNICSYDFLANNILTDIDGVLGLDFFMDKKICIDLKKFEITIH
ncbi:MAG: gag-polyprotein putative aspartyl protease [Bacteroidota bacterium]